MTAEDRKKRKKNLFGFDKIPLLHKRAKHQVKTLKIE